MAAPAPTSASASSLRTVPAQVGFLAIYNPTLGTTNATTDEQIVYYASVGAPTGRRRRHRSRARPTDGISQEERNEQLRQIGLAQGMVEFGRGFAAGQPVETIETEKSRIVLHELEPGWWILASLDLTRIPLPPRLGASGSKSKAKASDADNVEYSTREMKPAALLLQDLLRAHSIFLLHHGASLSALFVRTKRSKFVSILTRYWDLFLSTWNVMLHGNPARHMFRGIKIAASGELGVGVGEEERGSGDREMLEGFVDRVEGLVDLVVSKFGQPDRPPEKAVASHEAAADSSWLATGDEPGAEDGAIFLGVGALSKKSLRDITHWMEDLYTWGEHAYGVRESPTAIRFKPAQHRTSSSRMTSHSSRSRRGSRHAKGGPPPEASCDISVGDSRQISGTNSAREPSEGGVQRLVSYLKLGYGTHWTIGTSSVSEHPGPDSRAQQKSSKDGGGKEAETRRPSPMSAHYLIGMTGQVEDTASSGDADAEGPEGPEGPSAESDSRIMLRTLTVELESEAAGRSEADTTQVFGSHDNELHRSTTSGRADDTDPQSHFDSQDRNKIKKMRVAVYVSRPFIYTFLFESHTDSLAWGSLYKALHRQLAPLHHPLTVSTSYRAPKPDAGHGASHVFDLVWDPAALTIRCTIPDIPGPDAAVLPAQLPPPWSRAEAVNTHMQILNTYTAAHNNQASREQTAKTTRGWWVVWTRILHPPQPGRESSTERSDDTVDSTSPESDVDDEKAKKPESQDTVRPRPPPETDEKERGPDRTRREAKARVRKEIVLIRRAGEQGGGGGHVSSDPGSGWGDSVGRLGQGIGFDTRKYTESLGADGR